MIIFPFCQIFYPFLILYFYNILQHILLHFQIYIILYHVCIHLKNPQYMFPDQTIIVFLYYLFIVTFSLKISLLIEISLVLILMVSLLPFHDSIYFPTFSILALELVARSNLSSFALKNIIMELSFVF